MLIGFQIHNIFKSNKSRGHGVYLQRFVHPGSLWMWYHMTQPRKGRYPYLPRVYTGVAGSRSWTLAGVGEDRAPRMEVNIRIGTKEDFMMLVFFLPKKVDTWIEMVDGSYRPTSRSTYYTVKSPMPRS